MGLVIARRRGTPWAAVVGVPAVLTFALLTIAAMSGEPFAWENGLLTALHNRATPLFDDTAIWLSRLCHPTVLVALAALIAVGAALRRDWRTPLLALTGTGGALLLGNRAKEWVQRPRPDLWATLTGETNSGFPSGHATTSCAFAAVVVILCWRTRWRGVALGLAAAWVALIGLARLYLGVHYPTDVLGGWGLALSWVSLLQFAIARTGGQKG